MEWHLRSGYPLYSPEASAKMRLYPPPQNGLYYTPWLWVDGRQRGSGYTSWASHVQAALAVPTDVDLVLGGWYNPQTRTGEAEIEVVNDGLQPLEAACYVVVTEDSIYYSAPNGDEWHNHVCRDFVPDQYGTPVTVPAQARETLLVEYALDPGWDESRCNLVVFLQSHEVQPDSTRITSQGGLVPVAELVAVTERLDSRLGTSVLVVPNPATDRAEFRFAARAGARYELALFTVDGRSVARLSGITAGPAGSVIWNRKDALARRASRGVYGYRLTLPGRTATGRFVLAD